MHTKATDKRVRGFACIESKSEIVVLALLLYSTMFYIAQWMPWNGMRSLVYSNSNRPCENAICVLHSMQDQEQSLGANTKYTCITLWHTKTINWEQLNRRLICIHTHTLCTSCHIFCRKWKDILNFATPKICATIKSYAFKCIMNRTIFNMLTLSISHAQSDEFSLRSTFWVIFC